MSFINNAGNMVKKEEDDLKRKIAENNGITLDDRERSIKRYDRLAEIIKTHEKNNKQDAEDLRKLDVLLKRLEALRSQLDTTPIINGGKENTAPVQALEIKPFYSDLTQRAKTGDLPRCSGRVEEIRDIKAYIGMPANIAILGPSGTGKTTLVNGFVYSLLAENPEAKVWEVRVADLLAGTGLRGQLEERLKKLLDDAAACKAILIFDELHSILSIGRSADSGTDLGNILKPYLTDKKLFIIGATTQGEYDEHIAKDEALARRFRTLTLGDLSDEESLEVLYHKKSSIQERFNTRFDPEACLAVYMLSKVYLYNGKINSLTLSLGLMEELYIKNKDKEIITKRDVFRLVRDKGLSGKDNSRPSLTLMQIENTYNNVQLALSEANVDNFIEFNENPASLFPALKDSPQKTEYCRAVLNKIRPPVKLLIPPYIAFLLSMNNRSLIGDPEAFKNTLNFNKLMENSYYQFKSESSESEPIVYSLGAHIISRVMIHRDNLYNINYLYNTNGPCNKKEARELYILDSKKSDDSDNRESDDSDNREFELGEAYKSSEECDLYNKNTYSALLLRVFLYELKRDILNYAGRNKGKPCYQDYILCVSALEKFSSALQAYAGKEVYLSVNENHPQRYSQFSLDELQNALALKHDEIKKVTPLGDIKRHSSATSKQDINDEESLKLLYPEKIDLERQFSVKFTPQACLAAYILPKIYLYYDKNQSCLDQSRELITDLAIKNCNSFKADYKKITEADVFDLIKERLDKNRLEKKRLYDEWLEKQSPYNERRYMGSFDPKVTLSEINDEYRKFQLSFSEGSIDNFITPELEKGKDVEKLEYYRAVFDKAQPAEAIKISPEPSGKNRYKFYRAVGRVGSVLGSALVLPGRLFD